MYTSKIRNKFCTLYAYYNMAFRWYFIRFCSIFILGIGLQAMSYAQTRLDTDSLIKTILEEQDDTVKINKINKYFSFLRSKKPHDAYVLAQEQLSAAELIVYEKGIADANQNMGLIETDQGKYKLAIQHISEALKLREKIKDRAAIANSISSLGAVHYFQGDYQNAMNYYLQGLKIREELNDKASIANSCNNIGLLYAEQGIYKDAEEWLHKAFGIRKELNDFKGIAQTLNNLGMVYNLQTEYIKAIDYQLQALEMFYDLDDKREMANTMNNIGSSYGKSNNYEKALKYYMKSLELRKELGDEEGKATSYNNIGDLYLKQRKAQEALQYFNRSLEIGLKIGAYKRVKDVYDGMTRAYVQLGDYKRAYEYENMYAAIKDTIFNEETTKSIAEMQARFESEKAMELKGKENEVFESKLNIQKIISASVIVMLMLVLILSYFMFKISNERKIINDLLAEQNMMIEEKNKNITDSIRYAQRIQGAILPSQNFIQQHLSDSFLLNQPKDIVSGDFYWMATVENDNKIILATADCTGHGVPGAFMSMIGISVLKELVLERNVTQPDEILNGLRHEIIRSLNQQGELKSDEGSVDVKDGMDIVLYSIDKKNMKLHYAAAYNPFYMIRNGELKEMTPDKFPVGKFEGELKKFTLHEMNLQKGDCIYTFTDGYADQFGGPNGKKFKYKQLQEKLLEVHTLPMADQCMRLQTIINDWKGDNEQVDDILIIGVRV